MEKYVIYRCKLCGKTLITQFTNVLDMVNPDHACKNTKGTNFKPLFEIIATTDDKSDIDKIDYDISAIDDVYKDRDGNIVKTW